MSDESSDSVVRRTRFSGGPAREFLSSLAADERLFEADLAVDRAHVVMLAEQSILQEQDAGAILDALAMVEDQGHENLPESEDVHEAIETAVVERLGPVGGRMHTARSRNDEVAACIRYRLRADLLDLLGTLASGREALLEMAESEAQTIMPGYTHLQPAQPTTVGHWAASYESALARETERLLDAYERVNRSPLGAAAFAGTPWNIDRERVADLLGFNGLIENATDAVAARDVLVEVAAGLTTTAIAVSGLAEDGVLFANRGFFDPADEYASTSSIMPQKKNPDALELARARVGDATAAVAGLVGTLKGLPRAYNRDLQRATATFWPAVDAIGPAVEVAVGTMTTGDWDTAALETAAAEGFSTATGVADRLAMAGVPFRKAHEAVAEAAEAADGVPDIEAIDAAVRAVVGEPLDAFADREAIADALEVGESVAMRNSRGGPAPPALSASLERARDALSEDVETIDARRKQVETAANRRSAEVAEYV
ncbi:MAG: argininosuccinate lyase [Salinirussus sp.]